MGGKVQCPVCTLFLLPGMDLSDHLETHPKEQVIKALVQMSLKIEVAETVTPDNPKITNATSCIENDANHQATEDGKTTPMLETCENMVGINDRRRDLNEHIVLPSIPQNNSMNRQCGYLFENNSSSSSSSTSSNFFGPPTPYYQINHQLHNQQQQQQLQPQHNHIHNYHAYHGHPGSSQPMRLFSYQPTSKPLQPPPAYGAAISQLRSQNSQNLMVNNVSRPQYSPASYTSSSTMTVASSCLPPPLPPPPLNQRYQPNFGQMETPSFTETTGSSTMSPRRTSMTPPIRLPPELYRSPLSSTGQNSRQSNSPYTVMTGSPSVLRFAESPVTAHYLERENGDFIVQETPKHVVECVEKDDGEFSVIERVYHMPPSVVQINEDQDDDMSSDHGSNSEDIKMLEDDLPSGTWSGGRSPEQGPITQKEQQKKSGITVLSDVQLDLNEYLDLMGNIIASSKVAKTRTDMIKIEKFDPEEVKEEIASSLCLSGDEYENADDDALMETKKKEEVTDESLCIIPVAIAVACSSATLTPASSVTSVIRLATNPNARNTTPLNQYTHVEEPISGPKFEETGTPAADGMRITKVEEALTSTGTAKETMKETSLKPNVEKAASTDVTVTKVEEAMQTESLTDAQPEPQLQTEKPQVTEPLIRHVKKEERSPGPAYHQSVRRPIKKATKKLIIKPRSKVPIASIPIPIQKPSTSTEIPPFEPLKEEVLSEASETTQGNELKSIKTESLSTTSSDSIPPPLFADADEKLPLDDDVQPSTSDAIEAEEQASPVLPRPTSDDKPTADLVALLDQCMKKEEEAEDHPMHSLFGIQSTSDPLNDAMPASSAFPSASLFSKPLAKDAEQLIIPESILPDIKDIQKQEDDLSSSQQPVFPSASLFSKPLTKITEELIISESMPPDSCDIQETENLQPPPQQPAFPSATLFSKPLTKSTEQFIISESILPNSNDIQEQADPPPSQQQQSQPNQQQQQNTSTYVEYPFSFFYGTNHEEDIKHNVSPPIYCTEDFNKYSASTSGGNSASCTWYQSQSSENDFEMDGKGSYLDLDSCKRSTSFAAATEGSMPTTDTLNIRTDEKMPAKGEISEQESNCGVENSWSQALYNEFPVRFPNTYQNFMTAQESWSHDNYFRPQDLSSPVETKNFSLRLTEESPIMDTLPSTSKRKNKPVGKFARKKTFQCAHCKTDFPLLKEKNAHLVKQHGYKRVNRQLVRDPPTSTVTTATMNTEAGASLLLGLEPSALPPPPLAEEEDSKASIVKIEQDNKAAIRKERKSECKETISNLSLTSTVPAPTNANVSRTKYDSLRARDNRVLINFNLNALSIKNEGKSDVETHCYTDSKLAFFCFVCRRDFLTNKLYDEHLVEHPAECFTCHKTFTRWKNFMVHLKRHLGWKDFGCTICEKKFVIRSALVEHMRMHTGHTPLKCKVCGKSFKRYSNLTQHRKRHGIRINRNKEYVCYCGEVLPSKARFIWHKETHDLKPKCCPYCRDRFVHANSLRRHIRLAHSDKFDYTEPMECPMCKQIYAKSSIKAHMATHSMDTQHECLICSKSFSTKWNLKIHNWVHANRTSKPFKCDQCVKAFVREVDYNNHMNSHKQIKPYTCEHCGCKFIRKYNYIRHRREHHGNKKFTCDLCGKLFHRHYYLIEHRRIHTGERPFQCTICGKSSTTKTNHNKHLKIHHSRDPFTSEA